MRRRAVVLILALTPLCAVAGCFSWRWWDKQQYLSSTRIGERTTANDSAPALAAAEDWPAWRGPRGDGISRQVGLAEQWPAGGPPRVWSADVGLGYASPVAAAGRVYLFTLNNKKESLAAFDARTGHLLWADESPTGWTGDYAGTRATPAVDGDSVYTYGGAGELTSRDVATGRPRWRGDVLKLTNSSNLGYGTGSSPLVDGDRVYVQSGDGGPIAVALRKADGQAVWQSEARGVGGYAHPILADVAGARQLVIFGGDAVWSMDPDTGRTIWTEPWRTSYKVNSSTPVYADGKLFVTSAYGMGCMMLDLSPGGGATRAWANKKIRSKFQAPVLDRGSLYVNSEGRLTCLSWPDGAVRWQRSDLPLGEHGSFVRVGDRLLALSDTGELSLIRATPEGAEVVARTQAVEGSEVWSVPLIYGGRAYVKGPKELVCLDLTDPAARGGTTRPTTTR